jgi:hypothetical protein
MILNVYENSWFVISVVMGMPRWNSAWKDIFRIVILIRLPFCPLFLVCFHILPTFVSRFFPAGFIYPCGVLRYTKSGTITKPVLQHAKITILQLATVVTPDRVITSFVPARCQVNSIRTALTSVTSCSNVLPTGSSGKHQADFYI